MASPYRFNLSSRGIASISRPCATPSSWTAWRWGYTTWGCIDIVSAGTGEMRKRYGFIHVDADDSYQGTFERTPKDSFWWYKRVIASNGECLD